MTHVAIVETLDGRSSDWMEKVTDEQYTAPVRPRPAAAAVPAAAPAGKPTRLMGDVAPKLAQLTDDVLFGDVWVADLVLQWIDERVTRRSAGARSIVTPRAVPRSI
jgi:hypothetical protein